MHLETSVSELQRQLSGHVLVPTQGAYSDAVQIDNGRVQLTPGFIVRVDSTEDVVTCLRHAAKHGLRFTVKGGGHSATGYSLNTGGMVIDMSLLNAISLDRERKLVTVQMGARWYQVYTYLQQTGSGLIPIGGGCPTVGIPGFVQGGGYSFVSRSYGMSCDNLRSVTLVLADGSVRTVGTDSVGAERDLFWALRGGGGGNWGVVVSMQIAVHHPNTEKMLTAQLRFCAERAQQVLGFYNQWVETLPDAMAAYGIWSNSPDPADPARLIPTFGFTIIYNGEFAEGARLLQPLLEQSPLTASINALTLPQFELINGASTLVKGRSAYIRAGVMPPGAFSPACIAIFEKYMACAPSPDSFLVWTHGGGRISKLAADATAFPHRDGRFIPELKSIWDRPDQARANIEWAHAFFAELAPHFCGNYVNYIDPLLPDWQTQYYGDNYARLEEVKQAVDPANVFRFQQSVGSTYQPCVAQPLALAPLNRTFLD
ncbi:MAG: FAD-binding oxidoreductase [Pseudomonadota bacterium]